MFGVIRYIWVLKPNRHEVHVNGEKRKMLSVQLCECPNWHREKYNAPRHYICARVLLETITQTSYIVKFYSNLQTDFLLLIKSTLLNKV